MFDVPIVQQQSPIGHHPILASSYVYTVVVYIAGNPINIQQPSFIVRVCQYLPIRYECE
jgi:hypothetical protein